MKTSSSLHKIPDCLITVVLADGKPMPSLLIMVSLEMTKKNAFHMVFGPSNKEGKIEVFKKDLEWEAMRIQKMFPMDYDDLSSFKGEIDVGAMHLEEVESALGAYDLYLDTCDYPLGYREKLSIARATLNRLGPKRLDVKVTARPRNRGTRIITRSVMPRSNGTRLTKRSG